MGLSSASFGFADQIAVLDGSRFLQGVAGAMTWSGAFTWVLETESRERRGQTIGTLLGIAVAGALLGPPLGAIAEAVGTEPVFGSVLILSLILFTVAFRLEDAGDVAREKVGAVLRAMASRPILVAGLFLAVPVARVRRHRRARPAPHRRARGWRVHHRARLHHRRRRRGGDLALLGTGRRPPVVARALCRGACDHRRLDRRPRADRDAVPRRGRRRDGLDRRRASASRPRRRGSRTRPRPPAFIRGWPPV